MEREGVVNGGVHDGELISCEPFGYAPDTTRVWWLAQSKEKFTYDEDGFHPYEGPVVHGTGYTF